MIVVDTSALVAITRAEPEMELFVDAMNGADTVLMSAATRLEAFVVSHRRFGPGAAAEMERLTKGLSIVTIPFDEAQLLIALDAYRAYGAGRNRLNFGDCFSYALAKARGLPLLFKGDDFRRTDIVAAV